MAGLLTVEKFPTRITRMSEFRKYYLGHSRYSPIRGIRDEKPHDFKKTPISLEICLDKIQPLRKIKTNVRSFF
jgi:hypothetical protein